MPARKSTSKRERGAPSAEEREPDEALETAAKPAPVAKPPASGAANPERIPRLALTLGGVLLAVGLALVGGGPSDVGRVVALAALLGLIYGVHSFGRLGPA